MEKFKKYISSLNSVEQDMLSSAISAIIHDGREEVILNMKKEASELRIKIDARMKYVESLKDDLLITNKSIANLERANSNDPYTSSVISLLKQYASGLKNKIGELRPDDDLKRKSELETVSEALQARRDAAVTVETLIGEAIEIYDIKRYT